MYGPYISLELKAGGAIRILNDALDGSLDHQFTFRLHKMVQIILSLSVPF